LISFLRVPILDKTPAFRRYIIAPTTSNSGSRYRNLQTLLQTVCLRRTREISGLPDVVPEEKLLPLSDRERREYDELFGRSGNLVQMAVSGQRSKVSATVLHCIHELRLFCNNGQRRTGREHVETDDELLSDLQQHSLNNCANCSGPIFSIDQTGGSYGGTFISSCKHLVCHSCLPQCCKRKGDCVLCSRGDVPRRPSYDSIPALYCAGGNGDLLERLPEEYPSKLLALLKDLQAEPTSKW
jgi:SWI/SNF-related matrix-associated actin-dependent regulator of chromatin subfamily A3